MLTKQRLLLRAVSTVLCGAFFAQELHAAPAAPGAAGDPLTLRQGLLSNPSEIDVPPDFAQLAEFHKGSKDSLIIHIQDAHSNTSGQQNLANALDYLMEKYRIGLVLSEGGEGDCSLTSIKKIATPQTWKRVARSFLLNGELQGEEYLNLTSPRAMKILGIEDMSLYAKSLDNYTQLAARREKAVAHIQKIERAVKKLKGRLYPESLRDYEKLKDRDAGFEKTFRAFLKINRQAGMPALNGALAALQTTLKSEEALNFELANLERAVLLDELHQKAKAGDLAAVLAGERGNPGNHAALYSRFLKTLNTARESGIDVSKFENLNAYIEYLRAFTAVDMDAFLKDWENAEDALYQTVIASPASQARNDGLLVRQIDRFIALLRLAHEIRMTTPEHDAFKTGEPSFPLYAVEGFLNRKLAEQGYFDDVIGAETTLEEARKAIDDFYDSVAIRDLAFIQNIQKSMDSEGQKIAFLITGGYHTPHLKKLMREKGFGYAVLTPRVTTETNRPKYEKLLLSQRSALRAMLAATPQNNARFSKLQIAAGGRLAESSSAAQRLRINVGTLGRDVLRWSQDPKYAFGKDLKERLRKIGEELKEWASAGDIFSDNVENIKKEFAALFRITSDESLRGKTTFVRSALKGQHARIKNLQAALGALRDPAALAALASEKSRLETELEDIRAQIERADETRPAIPFRLLEKRDALMQRIGEIEDQTAGAPAPALPAGRRPAGGRLAEGVDPTVKEFLKTVEASPDFKKDTLAFTEVLNAISENPDLFGSLLKDDSLGFSSLRRVFERDPLFFAIALRAIFKEFILFQELSKDDSLGISSLRIVFEKDPIALELAFATISENYDIFRLLAKDETFGPFFLRRIIEEHPLGFLDILLDMPKNFDPVRKTSQALSEENSLGASSLKIAFDNDPFGYVQALVAISENSSFSTAFGRLISRGISLETIRKHFTLSPYSFALTMNALGELSPDYRFSSDGAVDLEKALREKNIIFNADVAASLNAARGMILAFNLDPSKVTVRYSDQVNEAMARSYFDEAVTLRPYDLKPSDGVNITFHDVGDIKNDSDREVDLLYEFFKYNLPKLSKKEVSAMRRAMGMKGGREVWAASSPHEDEIEQIMKAYRRQNGAHRPLLILGIRHPEAVPDLKKDLTAEGYKVLERNSTDQEFDKPFNGKAQGKRMGTADIVVLNTQGELWQLMALADHPIVGEDKNLMEPVSQGKKPLYFPGYFQNNTQILKFLRSRGAGEEITDLYRQIEDRRKNADVHAQAEAAREAFQSDFMPTGKFFASLLILSKMSGSRLAEEQPEMERIHHDAIILREKLLEQFPKELAAWPTPAFRRRASQISVGEDGLRYWDHGKEVQVFASEKYPGLVFKLPRNRKDKEYHDLLLEKLTAMRRYARRYAGLTFQDSTKEIHGRPFLNLPGIAPTFFSGEGLIVQEKAGLIEEEKEGETMSRKRLELVHTIYRLGGFYWDWKRSNEGLIDGRRVVVDLGAISTDRIGARLATERGESSRPKGARLAAKTDNLLFPSREIQLVNITQTHIALIQAFRSEDPRVPAPPAQKDILAYYTVMAAIASVPESLKEAFSRARGDEKEELYGEIVQTVKKMLQDAQPDPVETLMGYEWALAGEDRRTELIQTAPFWLLNNPDSGDPTEVMVHSIRKDGREEIRIFNGIRDIQYLYRPDGFAGSDALFFVLDSGERHLLTADGAYYAVTGEPVPKPDGTYEMAVTREGRSGVRQVHGYVPLPAESQAGPKKSFEDEARARHSALHTSLVLRVEAAVRTKVIEKRPSDEELARTELVLRALYDILPYGRSFPGEEPIQAISRGALRIQDMVSAAYRDRNLYAQDLPADPHVQDMKPQDVEQIILDTLSLGQPDVKAGVPFDLLYGTMEDPSLRNRTLTVKFRGTDWIRTLTGVSEVRPFFGENQEEDFLYVVRHPGDGRQERAAYDYNGSSYSVTDVSIRPGGLVAYSLEGAGGIGGRMVVHGDRIVDIRALGPPARPAGGRLATERGEFSLPKGARLAGRGPRTPASALDERVNTLLRTRTRPSPQDVARLTDDPDFSEETVFRIWESMGHERPVMDKSMIELNTIVPYTVRVADEIAGKYPEHEIIFLARDAEWLYDAFVTVYAGKYPNRLSRLYLAPASYRLVISSFGYGAPEKEALNDYLKTYGITPEKIKAGQKYLFIDAGFYGSIAETLIREMAMAWGDGFEYEKLTEGDDPAFRNLLVSARGGRQILDFEPVIDESKFPKSIPLAAESFKTGLYSKDPVNFLVAVAMQALPHHHGPFVRTKMIRGKREVFIDTRPPFEKNVDQPGDLNSRTNVNPAAALILQSALIRGVREKMGALAPASPVGRRPAGGRLASPKLPSLEYSKERNYVIGPFLEALGLRQARVISEFYWTKDQMREKQPGGPKDYRALHAYRIEPPPSKTLPGQMAKGMDILSRELGHSPAYDLLFNELDELIAIMPADFAPDDSRIMYLTGYNVPKDMVKRFYEPGMRERWDGIRERYQKDMNDIGYYRTLTTGRYRKPVNEHRPYALARIDPDSGSVRVREFSMSFGDGDTVDENSVLVPVFPGVYNPGHYVEADLSSYQTFFDEFLNADFSDTKDVLDAATGSGFVVWLQWMAARKRGIASGIRFHAYDLNPLAVLNARLFLQEILGLNVEIGEGDSPESLSRARYAYITANAPAYPRPVSENVAPSRSRQMWDGNLSGKIFADKMGRWMADRMDPRHKAVLWIGPHDSGAVKTYESFGLKVKPVIRGAHIITNPGTPQGARLAEESAENFVAVSAQNNDSALKRFARIRAQQAAEGLSDLFGYRRMDLHINNTGVPNGQNVQEVAVSGQQNRLVSLGQARDFTIFSTGFWMNDSMALRSQESRGAIRDVFIDDEFHRAGLVGKGDVVALFELFGGEMKRSTNVGSRELRKILLGSDFFGAKSDFQELKNLPDHNPGAGETGLSMADLRVNRDIGGPFHAGSIARVLKDGQTPSGARLATERGESSRPKGARLAETLPDDATYDKRPVNAGLLPKSIAVYDNYVLKTVNPDGKDLTALYGAAGLDLTNLFLSVNPTQVFLVGEYSNISAKELAAALKSKAMTRRLESLHKRVEIFTKDRESAKTMLYNSRNPKGSVDQTTLGYIASKSLRGYAFWWVVDKPAAFYPTLAYELYALGVPLDGVSVTTDSHGNLSISFPWGREGGQEKQRVVTFINENIERGTERYLKMIPSGIDVYYQRAAEGVPLGYSYENSFIQAIAERMNPAGIFVTDDYEGLEGKDRSAYFPEDKAGVERIPFDVPKDLDESIRRRDALFTRLSGGYGWEMTLRRKVSGARLALEGETIRPEDEPAIRQDGDTKELLAKLYLARRKGILGTDFHFLLDALRRQATIRFVEKSGLVRAEIYTSSFQLVTEYELDAAIEAEKKARLEPAAGPARSIADEAYSIIEPAAVSGHQGRMGLRVLTQLQTATPAIITLVIDRAANPEESRAVLMTQKAIQAKYPRAYFEFVDDEGNKVNGMASDPIPADIRPAAKRVVIHAPSKAGVEKARQWGAHFFLPVEAPERTGSDVEALPMIGVFIAAILVATQDAQTLGGNPLARQFMQSLTRKPFDQEKFAVFSIEKAAMNLDLLQELSIKRLTRIAYDKILQFTRMALQALGSAA